MTTNTNIKMSINPIKTALLLQYSQIQWIVNGYHEKKDKDKGFLPCCILNIIIHFLYLVCFVYQIPTHEYIFPFQF